MSSNPSRRPPSRRAFLKSVTAALASGSAAPPIVRGGAPTIALLLDPADPLSAAPPVRWAVDHLRRALEARGAAVTLARSAGAVGSVAARIRIGGAPPDGLRRGVEPTGPESLALLPSGVDGLRVWGSDDRGLVYALLDLAERLQTARDPVIALRAVERLEQRPANQIRSVTRMFTSEPEDKPWFHDRGFWDLYLTMLARERFNRFSLGLGLGYDAPRDVPDSYFYFAYPFFMAVPGHRVTARGLPERERDRNLETLGWIAAEAKRRGLHFQLGLWSHAYQFVDSPKLNYPIDGLTADKHGPYCRDAIRALLEACPAIGGVTLRGHSESGIPEGSYEFWQLLFDGIAGVGRRVEIDIHSKGIEHELLERALRTGLPVRVSAKYWAEHMGLPYQPASIRELERVPPAAGSARVDERRFTRYSYADYLREDRAWGVFYRMWPGTQRVLLWGDPILAAGYARHASFCGSLGLELCEPLTFKGRRGSGAPGGREPHRDPALRPPRGDWENYLYSYRLWGRLLYDPDERPETWRRLLASEFGPAASDCEAALGEASRILPLVTVAHHPSASNNRYWPEIYTNMPIVRADTAPAYPDTPAPRRFGAVSPLDPALFAGVDEAAGALLDGAPDGRYSPGEVARWLDDSAAAARTRLARARARVRGAGTSAFRRLAIDVETQAALGRFFAEKLRAGVVWTLYERTGSSDARAAALEHYRAARAAWAEAVAVTQGPYAADLAFGRDPWQRGHWSDRLAAIDSDLRDMEEAPAPEVIGRSAAAALAALGAIDSKRPPSPALNHPTPSAFRRGVPLSLELRAEADAGLVRVRLHYRHVNQAEPYQRAEMQGSPKRWAATIPADYTDSPYPLLYFFELESKDIKRWRHPDIGPTLSNQPYFVLRQAAGRAGSA